MPFYTGGRNTYYKDKSFFYTRLRLFFFYLGSLVLLGVISLQGLIICDIYGKLQNLAENGATSQGQLIAHHIQSGTKSTAYYLTYTYAVPTSPNLSKTYQAQRKVNEETYNRLAIGSQLPVRYLPTQPDIARLVDVKEDNFEFDKGLWILAGLVVAELYLLYHIITGHRVRAKKRFEEACRN